MNKFFKYIALSSLVLSSLSFAKDVKEEHYTIEQLPNLQQEVQHKDVTKRIVSRLTRSHFREFTLDENFADKILTRYLNLLDYGKYLFLASDIAKYKENAPSIVNELKNGQLELAYNIFNTAQKKRFQRYEYALSLLDIPMQFDSPDEINFDYDNIQWAVTEKELDDRWQTKVKYDALNLSLTGKKPDEIKKILKKRYSAAIKRLTQTNSEDAYQVFMNAFAREIDPHTSYLAPKSKKQFNSEMSLSLEGIGAVLKVEDDYAVIASLVTGGPAAKSKALGVGDKIIGVGQSDKSIEDVIGWRLDDTVELIRGPKGTKVQLEILPAGKNTKPKIITIVRDKIRLEDRAVKSSVTEINGNKIGVLTIPGFYIGLSENTKILLEGLKKKNIVSLVIDLRGNGGGALSEAIALSGLFITKGPVVQIKDTFKNTQQYDDTDGSIDYDGPLVVLIDRNSASASEIFAAAMQDYGRAVIVGEPSFGKGTVQTHQLLNHFYDKTLNPKWPELGALQYTIQKFYRINGGSTQLKGVIPDVEMPSAVINQEYGESYEDNALPWDSIPTANYSKIGNVAALVPALKKKHDERIKNDREFKYIKEDIEKFQKEKENRYIVSLNFKKREIENNEIDAKKLKRANERLVNKGEKPITSLEQLPKDIKLPDPYLEESEEIALDLYKGYLSSQQEKPKKN